MCKCIFSRDSLQDFEYGSNYGHKCMYSQCKLLVHEYGDYSNMTPIKNHKQLPELLYEVKTSLYPNTGWKPEGQFHR